MGYTKNIGSNLITQVIKIIVGMISGIIVARALGPTGQGYIAFILLVFNLLGSFGHLGITNAAMYFQKRKGLDRTAIFSTNMNMLILLSTGLGGLVLLSKNAGLWLADYNLLYIVGGILLAATTIINMHHQSWLIGDERIILNNQISIKVFLAKSFIIFACWIAGILSPALFFGITVVAMLVWMLLLQISMKEQWLRIISVPILKAEFGYGGVVWLSSMFAYLHYRADQVMIKYMMGLSELGVYTAAKSKAALGSESISWRRMMKASSGLRSAFRKACRV
jgi:O-antigen/teichoic acid export membrane protein